MRLIDLVGKEGKTLSIIRAPGTLYHKTETSRQQASLLFLDNNLACGQNIDEFGDFHGILLYILLLKPIQVACEENSHWAA